MFSKFINLLLKYPNDGIKYVDLVIPENTWEQKVADIQNYKADIFAMGNDWEGKFDFLKEYCEVVYLPRTEDISSTHLKVNLNEFLKNNRAGFEL